MPRLLDDCAVLREMFETKTAITRSGGTVPLHSNISAELADVLYDAVLAAQPSTVVEIGMAFGVSSLAILAALRRADRGGRLISIDPNQSTQWEGCGIRAIERAGYTDGHRMVEDFDYSALPKLLGAGQRAGFAYIDGWHTFDYTLLDFWYLDKMLEVGGVIGFDDCTFPAVDKVLRFVRSHRKYDELDVGLSGGAETYSGLRGRVKRILGQTLVKRIRDVSGRTPAMTAHNRYFRKMEHWEPSWDFFAEF